MLGTKKLKVFSRVLNGSSAACLRENLVRLNVYVSISDEFIKATRVLKLSCHKDTLRQSVYKTSFILCGNCSAIKKTVK